MIQNVSATRSPMFLFDIVNLVQLFTCLHALTAYGNQTMAVFTSYSRSVWLHMNDFAMNSAVE